MWLPADGAPNPHGPGGGGGGGLGGPKSAQRVQAIRFARVTTSDVEKDAEYAAAAKARASAQTSAIAETKAVRSSVKSLSEDLDKAYKALENLDGAQREHVSKMLNKLEMEEVKIQKKNQAIQRLEKKLNEAKRGQCEVMMGIASYKILCVLVIVLCVVSAVLGVLGIGKNK